MKFHKPSFTQWCITSYVSIQVDFSATGKVGAQTVPPEPKPAPVADNTAEADDGEEDGEEIDIDAI